MERTVPSPMDYKTKSAMHSKNLDLEASIFVIGVLVITVLHTTTLRPILIINLCQRNPLLVCNPMIFLILAVIKINHINDSRRSYQCVKFLVNISSKCGMAKDYLIQAPTKWQWAVNWLKKKASSK